MTYFKPPYSPDLIIDNNAENPDFENMVQNIIDTFEINLEKRYIYTKNNLLNFPIKYLYSKFEGEEFFELFKHDRKISLDFFKKITKTK